MGNPKVGDSACTSTNCTFHPHTGYRAEIIAKQGKILPYEAVREAIEAELAKSGAEEIVIHDEYPKGWNEPRLNNPNCLPGTFGEKVWVEAKWRPQPAPGKAVAKPVTVPVNTATYRICDAIVWLELVPSKKQPPGKKQPPDPVDPSKVDLPPGCKRATPVLDKPPKVTDAWALEVLGIAYRNKFGHPPAENELVIAAAISRGESYYGWPSATQAQKDSWYGHHNWGAIHARVQDYPCCTGGFIWRDGAKVLRPVCFASWSDNMKGAEGFIREIYQKRSPVLQAAKTGNVYEVAWWMRQTSYFCRRTGPNGSCATASLADKHADAVWYANAIWRHVEKIKASTGKGGGVRKEIPGTPPDPSKKDDPSKPPRVELPDARNKIASAAGATLLVIGVGVTVGGIAYARHAKKRHARKR